LWLFLSGVLCSASQGSQGTPAWEQFIGTWAGTWDTAGSGGGFEVTLAKGTSGALSGGVSVTGEPTYKAAFTTVTFDGNKMTAKYDFPAAEGAEVVLAGVFDGNRATGTWSLREKASGNEAATGGWNVTRK
jgi:hypothetical protein